MKLIVKNANKVIKNRKILCDINLSLESGNIYGFVGRNGSGKTMLFRALSGLIKIDSGEIICDNKVLHKDMDILENIGIVIENAGLYQEFTGFKNLKLLAEINKKINESEIKAVIQRVGLDPEDNRVLNKYSLGMKQRIIIAQAIMEKPDIIMLDEPTNSLDAHGVEEVRDIILQEKKRGAMILLASHNKEDISLLADKVFYMDDGHLTDGR
jgi:ABC-2 type transport system ATP-binding protein